MDIYQKLETLPKFVVDEIFLYLKARHIVALGLTCHRYYFLTNIMRQDFYRVFTIDHYKCDKCFLYTHCDNLKFCFKCRGLMCDKCDDTSECSGMGKHRYYVKTKIMI